MVEKEDKHLRTSSEGKNGSHFMFIQMEIHKMKFRGLKGGKRRRNTKMKHWRRILPKPMPDFDSKKENLS